MVIDEFLVVWRLGGLSLPVAVLNTEQILHDHWCKQEGPPIGGAVRNATPLILLSLVLKSFMHAHAYNMHVRNESNSDNNTKSAINVML